jgi:hypothetical protein
VRVAGSSCGFAGAAIMGSVTAGVDARGRRVAIACTGPAPATSRRFEAGCIMPLGSTGGESAGGRK